MKEFKGAIFDLDGTIIDSMDVWETIDIKFLEKRNITMPNDYIEKINSMSFEEVAKYTIERFNLNESVDSLIKEWNDMAIYEYSNNIKLKPNVKEYLVKLKKHDIKIGLATSSPKELYEPVLKNNKVYDYFDTFTSVDDVKRDKNYPDIYLYTAKKLGLYPNECIIFEDILIAINTAKESNFKAIGVYDKSSYNDLDKIFKWINDVEVRKNSFNSSYISYESHIRWFNEKINLNNIYIYIILNDNKEIGTIRLEKKDSKAIISYLIDNKYRGHGYGNETIKLIKKEAIINNIDILEASVKKDNMLSRKIFINNGFFEIEENDKYLYLYFLKKEKEIV